MPHGYCHLTAAQVRAIGASGNPFSAFYAARVYDFESFYEAYSHGIQVCVFKKNVLCAVGILCESFLQFDSSLPPSHLLIQHRIVEAAENDTSSRSHLSVCFELKRRETNEYGASVAWLSPNLPPASKKRNALFPRVLSPSVALVSVCVTPCFICAPVARLVR